MKPTINRTVNQKIKFALTATLLTAVAYPSGQAKASSPTLCIPVLSLESGHDMAAERGSENSGGDYGDVAPLSLQVPAATQYVNVMGKTLPTLPSFPAVTAKHGMVRGYVRDVKGRPIKGAIIGVRSTAVGGFYSGASAKSDANGYYEIAAPWGAAHFYCAGYAADYGDLIAAFGLHPADGELESFATANGAVKNWVLLSYGVGDRATAQDNPKYSGNYYGGTVILSYNIDSDDRSPTPRYLPANSQIEITLTPDGPLLDGSKGRTITVRKDVGNGISGRVYVNNIPVAKYSIKAKLVAGGPLKMREIGPYSQQPGGLEPKEATGTAALLLKIGGAKPNMATAGHGNWTEFSITLERP